MSTIKISNFENAIYNKSQNARSAWDRGVAKYALDIISELKERGINEVTPESPLFLKQCLNGAESWQQYSNGGCSLISDYDIVTRLGTQSERYKFHYGNLERPNARESWIQCQGRALEQAFRLLRDTATVHARMKDATTKAA